MSIKENITESIQESAETVAAVLGATKSLGEKGIKVTIPTIKVVPGVVYKYSYREANTKEGFGHGIDDGVQCVALYGPSAQGMISKLKREKFVNDHKKLCTIGGGIAAGAVGIFTLGTGLLAAGALTGIGALATSWGISQTKLDLYNYEVLAADVVVFTMRESMVKVESEYKNFVKEHQKEIDSYNVKEAKKAEAKEKKSTTTKKTTAKNKKEV